MAAPLALLGVLGGCKQAGPRIATPADLSPPPEVLLDPRWLGAPPLDRRFADALTACAAGVEDQSSRRGADFDAHLPGVLRLLAKAVALVPGSREIREPAYAAATELRAAATSLEARPSGPPEHSVQLRGALQRVAGLLVEVSAREYAGEPEIAARARGFQRRVQGIPAEPGDARRRGLLAAFDAGVEVLEEVLRATKAYAR